MKPNLYSVEIFCTLLIGSSGFHVPEFFIAFF